MFRNLLFILNMYKKIGLTKIKGKVLNNVYPWKDKLFTKQT